MNIITFLTDFGENSSYVAQMKGVASSIFPYSKFIDISHQIPSQNIKVAAFVLKSAVEFFPKGTVNVAVVDPGVGTNRHGILIVTKNQIFIGPDNGVLIPAARMFDDFQVYQINNKKFMRPIVSNTFHGRDIFTPVAANVLKGVSFDQIGLKINEFVDYSLPVPVIKDKKINAEVLFIDDFGNIITNIRESDISSLIRENDEIIIKIKHKVHKIKFTKSYGFVEPDNLLTTIGSSGFLEISKNKGNASDELKVSIDDKINIMIL